MKILGAIPMFGLILVVYTGILGVSYYSDPQTDLMSIKLIAFRLPSKQIWQPTMSDAIIIFGLLVLFIEILKSTRTSDSAIIEHVLSTFVFIAYMLVFLMAPMVANSTFLILSVMSLIDVIAGFTITISAARRDLSVN